MPDSDDFETRLASVERDVARLREQAALTSSDAAAARVLAAGSDRDVSEVRAELRAHTRSLNALRETQLEQGREITSLRQGLAEQGREMREGFATLATGMAQITALLTNLTGSERDGTERNRSSHGEFLPVSPVVATVQIPAASGCWPRRRARRRPASSRWQRVGR